MDRKIIDYLPPFVQEVREIQRIMDSEQPEFELSYDFLHRVLKDQFVDSATEAGLSRLERIMGIKIKGTDTIAERRFRILVLLNNQAVYTMRVLRESLADLLGQNGFYLTLDSDRFTLDVRLALGNKEMYGTIENYIRSVIPANIVLVVRVMFNPQSLLKKLKHKDMKPFTHKALREEVI